MISIKIVLPRNYL